MKRDFDRTRTEIQEMVDRETQAWDTQDLDLLMTIWHEDMVWPWPKTPKSHDPIEWTLEMGRYDYERWRGNWKELFVTHRLVHNRRVTRKIEVAEQCDGAFAVVDIDTLWESEQGEQMHWKGRVCKVYTKTEGGWKLIMHTGVLDYSDFGAI